MEINKMLSLANLMQNLKVGDPAESFEPLFGLLGISDSAGADLVRSIQSGKIDPKTKVADWLKNGGLVEYLARQNPNFKEPRAVPISCPHCQELIVLQG